MNYLSLQSLELYSETAKQVKSDGNDISKNLFAYAEEEDKKELKGSDLPNRMLINMLPLI